MLGRLLRHPDPLVLVGGHLLTLGLSLIEISWLHCLLWLGYHLLRLLSRFPSKARRGLQQIALLVLGSISSSFAVLPEDLNRSLLDLWLSDRSLGSKGRVHVSWHHVWVLVLLCPKVHLRLVKMVNHHLLLPLELSQVLCVLHSL